MASLSRANDGTAGFRLRLNAGADPSEDTLRGLAIDPTLLDGAAPFAAYAGIELPELWVVGGAGLDGPIFRPFIEAATRVTASIAGGSSVESMSQGEPTDRAV